MKIKTIYLVSDAMPIFRQVKFINNLKNINHAIYIRNMTRKILMRKFKTSYEYDYSILRT